jgi:GcrA cell cycle regulator
MAKDVHDRICWRTGCRVRAVHQISSGAFYCDEHVPYDWSDERIVFLRTLHSEGLSGSQIAKRFGVTRNAIIGKLSRLGLTGKGSGRGNSPRNAQSHLNAPGRRLNVVTHARPAAPSKPKIAAGRADGSALALVMHGPGSRFPQSGAAPIRTKGPVAGSLNLPMSHRDFGGCRYPTSGEEVSEHLFCCLPTDDGVPYCPAHAKICFAPVPTRGPKSASELARSLRRYL